MKIINAITHFPKDVAKVNTQKKLPLDDYRPRFGPNDLILETTLPICKKFLKDSNFNPLDLDLILNITLSPDRLFQDKTIAVPKVSHPIHHLIKADNAFVIDIHESDWNTAFSIAKSFMTDLNKKNVLIIRTEFLYTSVQPDYNTGFTIPDGVAMILAQQITDTIDVKYQNLKTNDIFCRYDMLQKGEALAKKTYRAKLKCSANDLYIDDLNHTGETFLNTMLDQYDNLDGVIIESWFPKHNISLSHSHKNFKEIKQRAPFNSLGIFTLPYYLSELKKEKKAFTLYSINYSPFLNRYSGTLLKL